MTPTIEEMKLVVAKMLPDILYPCCYHGDDNASLVIQWAGTTTVVKETEWLHVCWLAEQTLNAEETIQYVDCLIGGRKVLEFMAAMASFEERLTALCRVRCPEIFTT